MLPRHGRYEFSAITERPDYSWPGDKRLAVCLVTNLEVYAFRKGTGWDPAKINEPQNQRNYSWRDYGNRVGVWRLFDLFEDLNLPVAHNVNAYLVEECPKSLTEFGNVTMSFLYYERTLHPNMKRTEIRKFTYSICRVFK